MPLDVLEFHRRTNHTYASVRRPGRGMDWQIKPWPFKEYVDRPFIQLPAPRQAPPPEPTRLTLETLGHILYYCAGVTRVREFDGEPFYFRAYACAGALYPVELYVVTGDIDGLEAGVYHFHPKEHALRPLRATDNRGHLLAATANDPAVATAPVTVVLSGIYWRTMWKYEARGYRHLYWDSGMMLANLFAVAQAMRISARLLLSFVDDEVDRLLGLDGRHEVSLAMVPLGDGAMVQPAPTEPPEINPEVRPLSSREIEYADAMGAHDASRFRSTSEVGAFRKVRYAHDMRVLAGDRIQLNPMKSPPDRIERVILRRGSSRRFTSDPITFRQLSTILAPALDPLSCDFHDPAAAINQLFLIVNAVDGLSSGAYCLDPRSRELILIKTGAFRRDAGYLCLEQALLAQAAAVIFLMADLGAATSALGARGYRAAQLEAGILGGRLYLAAYALAVGATGSTFYDEEVTAFFAPAAGETSPMLAIGVGHDARRFRADL